MATGFFASPIHVTLAISCYGCLRQLGRGAQLHNFVPHFELLYPLILE